MASSLMSTEEAPWIDTVLKPIGSIEAGYQSFNQISTGSHFCRYPGEDLFLSPKLLFALSSDFCLESEIRFTKTHKHNLALDQLKQTGRYVILDDARGDPLAFSIGLELTEAISPFGLKDPSFIHHALFEAEAHAAVGKEWISEEHYQARIYSLFSFGIGIQGSPWTRGRIAASHRIFPDHLIHAYIEGQMGFGNENLHLYHFKGYGSIDYRLIDAVFEYIYFNEYSTISFKVLKSLYRRNCPVNVMQYILEFNYPFNF